MIVKNLGFLAYAESYALQERLAGEVYAGRAPETLLLLEHPPVYTVGRSGNFHNVLNSKVEAISVNRGGDVTFHCPGQLIAYPIIDLNRRRRDLHHYLRFLEEVLIQVAADFNVIAWRREGATGIWTEKGKLASIGAGARRWITMHGFALNVCNDLEGFKQINPCGIVDCAMVSLKLVATGSIDMEKVKQRTAIHFQDLLQRWLPLNAASGR